MGMCELGLGVRLHGVEALCVREAESIPKGPHTRESSGAGSRSANKQGHSSSRWRWWILRLSIGKPVVGVRTDNSGRDAV